MRENRTSAGSALPGVAHRPSPTVPLLLLVALALLGGDARAEESAEDKWINAVIRAAGTGKTERLEVLSREAEGDRWLALDALHERGFFEQARRFAGASPDGPKGPLARYARGMKTRELELRRALRAASALHEAGKSDEAKIRLGSLAPTQDSMTAIRLSRLLALLAETQGEVLSQLDHLQAASDAATRLGWATGAIEYMRERFVAAANSPRFTDLAWASLRALASLVEQGGSASDRLNLLLYEGGMLAREGRLNSGIERLRKARAAMKADPGQGDQAQVEATLAQVYVLLGDYASALRHGEAALALYAKQGFIPGVLYARGSLIAVYSEMGLDGDVLELGALQIKEVGDTDDLARAQAQLAVAISHARMEDSGAALEHFAAALRHFEATEDVELCAVTLLNRARELHLPGGDTEAATEDLREVARLTGASDRLKRHAQVALADTAARRGKAAEARSAYEAVLTSGEAESVVRLMAEIGLAELDFSAKRWASAHQHAQRGTELTRRQLEGLGTQGAHALLGNREHLRAARALIMAAAKLGKARLLLQALEASRALALLQNVGGGARLQGTGVSSGLREADAEAKASLRDARLKLERASVAKAPYAEQRALLGAVKKAEARWERAHARAEREHRRLLASAAPSTATLERLQAWLAPDEAFIAYYRMGDRLNALVVTGGTAAPAHVGDWSAILEKVEGVEALSSPDEEQAVDGQGRPTALVTLGRALLGRLPIKKSIEKLIISPVAEIANAPWPLLHDMQGQRTITIVPSASVLLAIAHDAIRFERPRLAVGVSKYGAVADRGAKAHLTKRGALPDLPNAAKEARAIWRGKPDVLLTDLDATEDTVVATLRKPDMRWSIAHFASHGLLHRERPALSSLALRPGGSEDGFLTVTELISTRLDAGLVVLSACDVGTLHDLPGEGYVGLPPALFASGAQRILANLWKIDDSAGAEFMSRLYAEMGKGRGPARALALTQQSFREGPKKWRHPYYWAGWVLWGSPRS